MIDLKNIKYDIDKDMMFFMDSEIVDKEEAANLIGISKNTFYSALLGKEVSNEVREKFYSYIFSHGYRINKLKEEFLKDYYDLVLFHGSKEGIKEITCDGSRGNCDFGNGFYLGESYDNALSFICDNENSNVYSFKLDLNNLNVLKFDLDIEWVLTICYFRGQLEEYKDNRTLLKIINKVNAADVIIAPVADNRMFYIMSLFTNGDINADVALHSLSASKLGLQYVIKSEKALTNLVTLEKYYLCKEEKKACHVRLENRTLEIETQLKMAKREYKDGKYIEEILC